MKITSSQKSIELVLGTLDRTILPELQSAPARGAVELIRATLLDLVQRQHAASDLLARCLLEGRELEDDLLAALGDAAKGDEAVAADESFDRRATRHEALTQRIDALCARLSERGGDAVLLRRAAQWELSYYAGLQTLPKPALDLSTAGEQAPPLSREFLQDFLNERRATGSARIEVTQFEPVLGGFGKQTFLCSTRNADGVDADLVVRKSDPTPIMLHGVFRLEQEYELLRALSRTSFPVPHPIDLAFDLPGVDGTFYTMNRLPGRVAGSFLGQNQTVSEDLLLRLAGLLAELHRIPLTTFSDYFARFEEPAAVSETIEARYRRNLRGWRQYVAQVEHLPSPFITWLFDWLERNVPADTRPTVLTHGDFNIHNVMVEADRVSGVLDWECADFGAPEQDLAYIQPHVSQHMDWQRFLDHYHASGGPDIDASRMPFCLAYSTLRTMLGGNRGVRNLQLGHNRDIRYVMVELGFAPTFMQMALACTQ